MLRIHMYAHNVKGFLHWGYNSYYDMLSHVLVDPEAEPCLYDGKKTGTSFLVYPSSDGKAIQSIRQKVFYEE